MIHNINFSKLVVIDWLKEFIILEHVFYNLSYAITMSNMIKETIKNVFNNLMIHAINKNDKKKQLQLHKTYHFISQV
jgi:hypothetical protein